MAEQAPSIPEQEAADHEPAPAKQGSSLLARLFVVLFLIGVVAVECLVAYLYIPSPSQTAAMAGVATAADPEADSPSDVGEQGAGELLDKEDQVEVDLGKFTVTAFQPISSTTLRIDFHLYGTVDADDATQFDETWQENTHRLRDQVIMTVRACDLAELTDAGLGLIKRKILEKINRTLGKPLLQAVIFSDFSFIEQ